MTGYGVHIHRWRNEYIVPREHLAPEKARAELDEIASHLPDELCAGLASWASGQAESVVLLNRVVLDCELDLSRDSWLLVTRWAHQFARALIRSVDTEVDGMLQFPSQAAFRAQFISDVAGGHAWRLWYYRSFQGLQALPASGAIRTLLLEDVELGRATMVELSPGAWHRVASAITRGDALRILDGLSDDDDTIDSATVLSLSKLIKTGMPAGAAWFARALRLFADLLRTGVRPTRAVARLSRVAAKISMPGAAADIHEVAAALSVGNIATLMAADPERDAETWSALAAHSEWLPALAAAIVDTAAQSPAASAKTSHVFTSFAGLAMLVPEIDGLLTANVCRVIPHASIAEPRALAAWLALAHCAGSDLTHAFLHDSFWRSFFGISAKVDLHGVLEWLESSDASLALSYLGDAAEPLVRGQPVVTSFRTAGEFRRVLIDPSTQIWVRLADLPLDTSPWQKRLAAARLARADWKYLATSYLPAGWQLFFTQLAQIVLRRFAYRVPGFAGTSLPYLNANFLAAAGRWDMATGQLKLSRPPLYTLLQITGIGRGAVRWSGPPVRQLLPEFES